MICIDLWYLHNAVFALTFGVSPKFGVSLDTQKFRHASKRREKNPEILCVFCVLELPAAV